MILIPKRWMQNDMQNKRKMLSPKGTWVPRGTQRMSCAGCPFLRVPLSTDGHASQERRPRAADAEMGWILQWQVVKRGWQAERWQRWPHHSTGLAELQPHITWAPMGPEQQGRRCSGHFQPPRLFWPHYNKAPLIEITSVCFYSLLPNRKSIK